MTSRPISRILSCLLCLISGSTPSCLALTSLMSPPPLAATVVRSDLSESKSLCIKPTNFADRHSILPISSIAIKPALGASSSSFCK